MQYIVAAIIGFLTFNFIVGLVVCYEAAKKSWHDAKLNRFKKWLRSPQMRIYRKQ